MYRLNGFLVLTVGILAFLGGGWLLWHVISGVMGASPPLEATGLMPAWLVTFGKLAFSVFLLYFSIRMVRASFCLLREEDSFLFFLPAEAWPVLLGILAVVVFTFQMNEKIRSFLFSERPKHCVPRQSLSVPASGPEWACYKGGKWARAGEWRKGKKHGRWLEWYVNGKRKWEGTYRNGKKHGTFAFYNIMGRQVTSYRYKNNLLHGPYVLRYNRGQLTPIKLQGHYDKGKKCGKWVFWDAFLRQGLMQQKRSRVLQYPECSQE